MVGSFKVFILIALAAVCAAAQVPDADKKSPQKVASAGPAASFELLAEGSNGNIASPFIYVARSKETYAALQKVVENLPARIDFSKTAVVAAFLGTKPTGGYGIEISANTPDDKYLGAVVSIAAVNPVPGRPVTDALTSPFKVVAVPVDKDKTFKVGAGAEWKAAAEVYSVRSGRFIVSSVTMPIYLEEIQAAGTISIWRSGQLATCAFDLFVAGDSTRILWETASGTLDKETLSLPRVDAGGFIKKSHYPLQVRGKLAPEKFMLEFTPAKTASYGSTVHYKGEGRLEFARQR